MTVPTRTPRFLEEDLATALVWVFAALLLSLLARGSEGLVLDPGLWGSVPTVMVRR